MRLAPTEKFSRSPEMTKAGEIANRIGGGVEDGGDESENVAADGVLERVQLDAGNAVAEIDERSAGVGADERRANGCGGSRRRGRDRGQRGWEWFGL